MPEHPAEKKNGNTIKIFGMIIPLLPGMFFRFGGSFLRFKGTAQKGGDVFHRELIHQGIDKTTAIKLTDLYLEGSNLMDFIRYFR